MRVLDFSDGFESESTPTQGSVTSNARPVFANDAAFEADKGGAGAAGDKYQNSTSGKFRRHNGTDWVDDTDQAFANDAAYEADNGAGAAGDTYLNTTTNRQRYYDGTQWANSATILGTVSAKAADYIVLDDDNVMNILMTVGGLDRTVTLPTAADNVDRVLFIKKVDATDGDCVIDGEGAETIDGAADYTLSVMNESVTVQCDGTGWFVLSRYVPFIGARYNTNTQQQINNNTQTTMDYEDKVYDSANNGSDLVTVGGSWQFDAPKTGKYRVTAAIAMGAPQSVQLLNSINRIDAFVNAARVASIGYVASMTSSVTALSPIGATTLNLVKGDLLHFSVLQNNGDFRTTTAAPEDNWACIEFVGE